MNCHFEMQFARIRRRIGASRQAKWKFTAKNKAHCRLARRRKRMYKMSLEIERRDARVSAAVASEWLRQRRVCECAALNESAQNRNRNDIRAAQIGD